MTSMRRWDRLAEELEFTQLKDVRAAAEQWRNGIGALTGALGTVSILKGAETFADIPTGIARVLAIGGSAVALVCLLVGTALAMRAAFAHPTLAENSAEVMKANVEQEVKTSLNYLKWSKRVVVVGLLGLLTAIAVAWINTPQEKSDWKIVLKDGSSICGPLAGVSQVELQVKIGDSVTTYPWTQIATVTSAGCD